MAHDYQRCLDELAATMPQRKAALIRCPSSRNRSSARGGPVSESDLGGTAKRGPADQLSRVSHDRLAGEKNEETNRAQEWGKNDQNL